MSEIRLRYVAPFNTQKGQKPLHAKTSFNAEARGPGWFISTTLIIPKRNNSLFMSGIRPEM